MKKILTTAAVLLISAVAMFSCSRSKKADGTITVGFSQVGAESAWRVANTESIQSEAKKRPNIKLIFSDAQQKQENQIKAIRNFIAQGVDVIAFSPVVETGFEAVLQEAKEAGIPVILVDRKVDVQDDSLWTTFMGSDFVEEGRRAARWLIENGYTNVKIAELQGTVGSAPAIDRKKGFEEVIADHPGMVIIKSQSGNFTRSGGKEIMEAFLKTEGKNINVLFSHNDDMAIGAIQAIEEYGLVPGKDIIIVSIDGVRGAFEAMIKGKLNCTVECSPLLGPQLFDAVEALSRGESIPKKIVTKEGVFPQKVAAEVINSRAY